MLIVIEGVDKAGKTTLAHELQRLEPNLQYRHFGKPGKDVFREYVGPLQFHHPTDSANVIDRFHWGEMVWGPMFRGKAGLTFEQFLYIEMLLQARGAVMCLVNPGLETLRKRHEAEPDDVLPWERVEEAVERYGALYQCVNTVSVRGSEWDAGLVAALARAEAQRCMRLPITYVGAPYPDVVFVGERRNDPDHWCKLPFAPINGMSGKHLMQALPVSLYGRCGFVNVHEADMHALRKELGEHVQFAALGREACRVLDSIELPHSSAPHPQYARRFHFDDLLGYTYALHAASRGAHITKKEIGWR